MYLTDEEMDEQGQWYDKNRDERGQCLHRETSPQQISDDTIVDVCDLCGRRLAEPYRPYN